MKEETLNKMLLDGHIEMKSTIAKIGEIIERHDEETFPGMKKDILDTKQAVTRIESKQNEDMAKFVAEKEAIYQRLTPLEMDLKRRLDSEKDTKARIKAIIWDGVGKIVYVIVGALFVYWQIIKNKLLQ